MTLTPLSREQQLEQLINSAPKEMSRPAKWGTTQSKELPRNKVHIPPKPIASSFFQGSRKNRPENPYTKVSAKIMMRGIDLVAAAVSLTMRNYMQNQ